MLQKMIDGRAQQVASLDMDHIRKMILKLKWIGLSDEADQLARMAPRDGLLDCLMGPMDAD